MPPSALQLIYLAGPTASGKSDIAVALALRLGGEIIGADAFQIYAGLDLLTAKPSAELRAQVPHHLIGEIPLTESFDVAQYRAAATQCIADITARGRTPIIVGGTGLYLRALTHGLAELPPANAALRAQLEAEPLPALVERYTQLDPVGATQVDLKNPRRVIRALEVCLLTGQPFSTFRAQTEPTEPIRGFVLLHDREVLNTRIDQRTHRMFASGVVEEVRHCPEPSPTAAQAIGYREITSLLRGEITEPDCIARIQLLTRQYAKRQLTWFRRETHLTPVPVIESDTPDSIAARIASAISPSPSLPTSA